MNHIAVGIGEVLWDVFPNGRTIGGAPANFAYHTAQLGLDSYIVSAVGNDVLGNETENVLKTKDLNPTFCAQIIPQGQSQFPLTNMVFRNMTFKNRPRGIIYRSMRNWYNLPNGQASYVSGRWHNGMPRVVVPSGNFLKQCLIPTRHSKCSTSIFGKTFSTRNC